MKWSLQMNCNTKPLIIKCIKPKSEHIEAGFILLFQFLDHSVFWKCPAQLANSNYNLQEPKLSLTWKVLIRLVLDCYIVFTFERYCPNCCGAQSVCIAMLNVWRFYLLIKCIYMYVKDIVQISGIFRTLQARTKRQCPNNSFMYV